MVRIDVAVSKVQRSKTQRSATHSAPLVVEAERAVASEKDGRAIEEAEGAREWLHKLAVKLLALINRQAICR